MSVRSLVESRLAARWSGEDGAGEASLPAWLKVDRGGARVALFRRLSASRAFALGDRAGALRTAQRRSGRAFRLDVRQRVIVKALVSRHSGRGALRGAALAQHVAYLGRSGAGVEGAKPEFFDRSQDQADAQSATTGWANDRHHFRFIISPEHGDRILDLKAYTRDVMDRVAADLSAPDLEWIGTCHFDTDQPHAHVLVRGRRSSGRDLVIPREYIAHGFRGRAQEAAQERLGDLSRPDAERQAWRDTEAERFTALDRRLLAAADEGRRVEDGVGRTDAWSALTRGRLRHLERLGLAERVGRQFRLHADLERKLRGLQLQKDIIRTFNQRRFAGARHVQAFAGERLEGQVVRAGSHDELGSTPYLIVADRNGVEHYARLRAGADLPQIGASVTLIQGERGAEIARDLGRGAGIER